MDRLTVMLTCGAAFALPFTIGGFFFGGLARVFAQKWRRTPETGPGQAFFVGAVRGAKFSAIIGLLLGGLAGWLQKPDSADFDLTVAFLQSLGLAAAIALAGGTLGYFLEWLGESSAPQKPQEQDTPEVD